MAARARTIVGDDSIPYLPRHVRLRFSEIRGAWAVLSPERVFWPDETSLEILRCCNGRDSAGRISQILARQYDAPLGQVKPDVLEFLQQWTDTLLIRCVDMTGAAS